MFGLGKVDLWKFNVEKLVPEIIYGCCKNRDFQSFPYWTKGPGINLAFLNGNDSGTQLVKESVDNVMQENSYLSWKTLILNRNWYDTFTLFQEAGFGSKWSQTKAHLN